MAPRVTSEAWEFTGEEVVQNMSRAGQLTLDLDFAGERTDYANHAIHSYSAKFPPQLAAWAIQQYTSTGETVLDPMLGSGTTLVEARRLGRNALGADIDPLARLLSRAKSNPPAPHQLAAAARRLLCIVEADLQRLRMGSRPAIPMPVPDFPNLEYWFFPETIQELALLKARIMEIDPSPVRDTLLVAFSSLIITKGKRSVANVADLAHSRPHRVEPETPPDVLLLLRQRLKKLQSATERFWDACVTDTYARVIGADARSMALPDESVDLVFTSPPYVNAIDYPRAHKFSVFWLAEALGISSVEYSELGRKYIGTDRVPLDECRQRVGGARFDLELLDHSIAQLSAIEERRAGVTHRYFAEIQAVLAESARVIRRGRRVVFVVCPSVIARVEIPTHRIIAEVGESLHRISGYTLEWEETIERTLDDSKRQLPILRGRFGPGMRTEYVVVMRKP
ncbi:MAG TPA: DNA methyltransferase [Armatimonadota bacterium]|nr:DNA methyltransferase [Armatimonadota bacterium]